MTITQRSVLFLLQVFVYFLILRNELECDYVGGYEDLLLPEETGNI